MLKEMQEAGLKPHPAAHQAALSAVATTEGHEAALALLATMKVRLPSIQRKRGITYLCQHPAPGVGGMIPVLICTRALYYGCTTPVCISLLGGRKADMGVKLLRADT